jgi:mannitol 2-dehydrogenase
VGAFFAKIEREEIMPTVPPVPGVVLDDYYHLIHRRFSNPKIGDTIPRLAFDGSNRQPKFIVPVARDRLKAGGSVDALAFESALWCRHCFGKTETGKDITAGDPVWPRLAELAAKAKTDPLVWLTMDDVYGDVAQAEPFRKTFAMSLTDIWSKGTQRALADFVGG